MKLDTLREGNKKKTIVQDQTLSQVIVQLLPFMVFPVIDSSVDYLRYYLRELNETSDIDRGQIESVNMYSSLLFLEFMCFVFICLLQNQNNYD